MSVPFIRKVTMYVKDSQDFGLFTFMSSPRLLTFFAASPLYIVMLPFIGVLNTVLALLNGVELAGSSNKNFDRSLKFVVSTLCALLSSVSLYGNAIAKACGFAFPIAPWFFFSSLTVAASFQALMFAVNMYRAYESPTSSQQRMHHLQAALNNLFLATNLIFAMGAVFFVLIMPAIPYIGMVCAIATVSMMALNVLWRLSPYSWKQAIKSFLHLGKPQLMQIEQTHRDSEPRQQIANDEKQTHARLFTCIDYSEVVKTKDLSAATAYLSQVIDAKIKLLQGGVHQGDKKIQDKIAVLTQLNDSISQQSDVNKRQLQNTYSLAFQSFWKEKGEVEQIVDAAVALLAKNKKPEERAVPLMPVYN